MSQKIKLHYDFLFKVILIGKEENIKTGLLWAFTGYHDLILDGKKTIGVNFGLTSIYLNQCAIKFQIWDISSDPKIKSMRPTYFKGASGCIMVISSIEEAYYYLEEIKANCNKPLPIVFIYVTEEPQNLHFNKLLPEFNVETVSSGSDGLEWLAEVMRSSHKKNIENLAAFYVISHDQIQETLQELYQDQIRSEMERFENERRERVEQTNLIREILEKMEIPVDQESVKILSSQFMFDVNILTGNVEVYSLKCDQCQESCKKHGHICIIPASTGWSDDLDAISLLILSKIFALTTNQLPSHVKNQIKNITYCHHFRPKDSYSNIH